MVNPTGFLEHPRQAPGKRPISERVRDYDEVSQAMPLPVLQKQAARCMDCGVPFCHQGCPLGNLIPDWNDLVSRDRWREAIDRLHATNNFPEFTGKLCPAPCEASCVLGINDDPVTIKAVEEAIIDRAWQEGWIVPEPPETRTGKRVAVVGSGPAGLTVAQQLARIGHEVTVFERDDRIGGLLRYGIPDFKMHKAAIDRRVDQLRAEGVRFEAGVHIGNDLPGHQLLDDFDAICLCCGALQPRDLEIPGRELDGIHFAMEFLPMQNRVVAGDDLPSERFITAEDKHVIIIGGGDTGADCLGTVHRQGCRSVQQFMIHPKPPEVRDSLENPWPQWSNVFRASAAHEEGGDRLFSIQTKRFVGQDGRVTGVETVQVEVQATEEGRARRVEMPGSETIHPADLVLLAIGYNGTEPGLLLEQLEVPLDERGRVIAAHGKRTANPKVFVSGDMSRGQSLIVWAIAEGRQTAREIDEFLMGHSDLPSPLVHHNDRMPFV